ncbi:MAG: hypothetical protein ACYCPT_03835 [Acidimicrobiales bacterium]
MNFLNELTKYISRFTHSSSNNTDFISNLKQIELRSYDIIELKSIYTKILSLSTTVKHQLDNLMAIHTFDITNLNKCLNTLYKNNTTIPCPQLPILPNQTESITLIRDITINAIPVALFDQVIQDGMLYYVIPADHFAIKINGHLFHGHIGHIFINEKSPHKIKECRFNNLCIKKDACEYYHDPMRISTSRDHRNYAINTWDTHKKNDITTIATDISTLSTENITILSDRLMHDLLYILALQQNSKLKTALE